MLKIVPYYLKNQKYADHILFWVKFTHNMNNMTLEILTILVLTFTIK